VACERGAGLWDRVRGALADSAVRGAGSAADKRGPQGRGWGRARAMLARWLPCGLLGRVSGMGHGKESVRAGFGAEKSGPRDRVGLG